ncbi:menaquinone reductase molybdopterin-binding-like subunit QrcB [Desulfobacula toluolica]|uniref:Predicted, olybdopterin oxidoreductase n=1 Tax=Desulfobacula toluolica (strain DSM 7467 / Tol2) TaxID=651182 RepID=K0NJL6_DESTT|nr:menaquinone reductase molybdopterin-binding-like subunit QrcB [Desulfobacula toluolica]CCK80053.1 predicted, olybdopterin oxidoreductase [Desulfobacula toluolica Tol2]
MKVDRRSFLGLGLGAVAGIAVSPVGIKLTDDSSIWTQNWPWTPVPVDGEVKYESSVCSLCPGSCGINVRKIDDRPVKIEGLADHPINAGGACLHGIAGLQYLYDPSRVKTPLKKNGDNFEEISWDDAIALVAEKLSAIRKSGSPEKLACITDNDQGSVCGLFKRLLKTFGSPNFYTMPSLESYLEMTAATVHGKGNTIGFDLENSSFVLSFGAGIIEGWGSPVNCFKANASRKERHAKLYQIEPRLSNTAANADKWIPIKPGTEADLALGMCAVILKNNLFDSAAAANFKGGLNKLDALLQKDYTPAKTSEITGVKVSDIEKIATLFAKSKMPVAVFGKGRGNGSQSLKELVAVHTLNCLVGNINKKGGVFVQPQNEYLKFPNKLMDGVADTGVAKNRAGQEINQLFETITKSSKPAVEALFVYNANPCYELHDSKRIKQAFEKIPFVVSFSSFLDETAKQADIILPSHTFIERLEDVPSGGGLSKKVVGLTKPVSKPVFNTKNPGDTLILIAKALEGNIARSFDWESYEQCLESVTPGIWDALSEDGYAVLSEGVPTRLVSVNVSFIADNPAKVQAQGDYELTLIPIDNIRLISSGTSASPFAVKTVSDKVLKGMDSFVEINPLTARGFGLKDNGYATLTTPMGSARVMVNFNEGMMPGVIGMVKGLGHTFDNKYVSNKGINVNDLIGPVIESGSGLDAAFGIKAKISKA